MVSLGAPIRPIAAAVILAFATAPMAFAQADTDPPVLIDFEFDPAAVDLVADRAQVEARLEVSDALSGVSSVSCGIESQSGWIYIGTGTGTPSSGDRNRGVFTILFDVPRFLEEGTWHVANCRATDQVGNQAAWTYANLTALGFQPEFRAGFLPGAPSAVISYHLDGKRVRGNSLTIKAELARGSPDDVSKTLGVRFEVRALPSGGFTPIHPRHPIHPNPDTRYPYFTHWDTSNVPNGDYELRAVAQSLDGTSDPAPETISLTIDHVNSIDIDENFTGDGIQESHAAVDDTRENYVASGDSSPSDSAAEIFLPAGALTSPTDTVILRFPDPAGEEPLLDPVDQSLGIFVDLAFQSGETKLESGYWADLLVSYPDEDQDGYLDGTDIRESDLESRYYDFDANAYKRFFWRVLPEHNMLYVQTRFAGRFAIVPAPWRWQGLANAERACVDVMSKSGEKVNQAQLKESERCLIDFQNEKLVTPMTFDRCMTADRRGKLQRAEAKTAMRETTKCVPLDAPARFTHANSATVNATAVEGALALTRQIFGGPPVIDANLATKAADRDAAKCQLELLKRAGKLESTVVKRLNKIKKQILKDETIDSDGALEEKIRVVFSTDDKIDRAQDTLVKKVDKKCAAVQSAPDEIFPGRCGEGNPSLREIETCVIAAARCVACMQINAIDDLDLDCDQADDREGNESCPLQANDNGGIYLTNADCFPTSLPDSAPDNAKICVALANFAPNMPFTPADYEGLPEECKEIVFPACR